MKIQDGYELNCKGSASDNSQYSSCHYVHSSFYL